jgi:hypothetical protein
MLNVCDVVGDPLSGFLKAGSVWCKCIKKDNFEKCNDLIIYLKKRWAQ